MAMQILGAALVAAFIFGACPKGVNLRHSKTCPECPKLGVEQT